MQYKVQNKHIVYVLIFIITIVMIYSLLTGVIIGFAQDVPLFPNGVMFVFFHASLLHYALNTIAMLSLIPEIKNIRLSIFCLLIILTISANVVAVGLFSPMLTVGLSGVFCGIVGYLAVDQYVKSKRTVFIVESFGLIVFTLFFPMVSLEGHFSGLVLGVALATLYHFVRHIRLKFLKLDNRLPSRE